MGTQRGKLLYVINHMDWFWSHRLPLALAAKEDGWDVHVACHGAQDDEQLSAHGFTGHNLPSSSDGFALFAALKIISAVDGLIKYLQPNLIHAVTIKYAFLAGLAARKYTDVKIIHTIAGSGFLFSEDSQKAKILRFLVGPFLKIALKHPRAQIIFQNPDDESVFVKRGFVDSARCHLIRGSGVDLEQFTLGLDTETEEPIVLMPTRLVHDKGVAVFIAAAKVISSRGIHAKFQIAGGVSRNNPLAISEKEMEKMLEDSPVEWLGKVDDMPALYKASTLICYPSYYGEGVPKVLLEAAACGRAIVTTDHPGCREAVQDGNNGLLVPIKDVEATAEAVIALIENQSRRKLMGVAGRKLMAEVFDVKLIVKNTLSIYKTALVS